MKRKLAFSLLAVALLACGGAVDGTNPSSLAGCPNGTHTGKACSTGNECRRTTDWCGRTLQDKCTCLSSRWSCEVNDGPPCADASGPPTPPRETCGIAGAVTDGERCYPEEKGQSCRRYADGCIVDQTCTCDGSKFVCAGPPISCDGGAPDAGADAPADG